MISSCGRESFGFLDNSLLYIMFNSLTSRWDDYVHGLNIAADRGSVSCKPRMTIIVNTDQKRVIEKGGIEFDN